MMPTLDLDLDGAMREVEAVLRSVVRCDEPILAEMAMKAVANGGKRLRPRIMLLSYAACGASKPLPELLEAAAGIELIHTATLVHDDIIDHSETRRAHLSTQREFGPDRAIVAGDYLFTKGFELSARQDAMVVALTARACTRLAEGQLLELGSMERRDLDLERYLRIIDGKTAAPLEACGRVGAHFAGRDDLQGPLGDYGRNLGLAFQVSDDLLDLRGDPRVTGKPVGNDLRNGAPSAPLVLGMANGARAKLQRVVGRRLGSEVEVQDAIATILASGAMEEAERLAAGFAAKAIEALAALPDSPARRELAAQVKRLPGRAA
jgi:octaprenyl-diphosphate synthase